MKQYFFLLLAFATLFTACDNMGKNSYKIDGKASFTSSKPIYLELLLPNKTVTLDTAQVNENGDFAFKGTFEHEGLYRFRLGSQQWVFLMNNKPITAQLDPTNPNEYSITGNPVNAQLQDLLMDTRVAVSDMQATQQQAIILQSQGNNVDSLMKVLSDNNAALENKLAQVMDTAQNVYLGFYAAASLSSGKHLKEQKAFLKRMETEIPASPYTMEFKKMLNKIALNYKQQQQQEVAAKQTATGSGAPEITLQDPYGKTRNLSDLRGKVVLIDFWASWCGPCRAENPRVVSLYEQYKNKGFEIYSVSLDKNRDRWVKAILDDGLAWENHVSDLQGWKSGPAKLYGVSGIPATFLLDEQGNIIAKNLRGQALENKLKEVLS